MAKKAFYKGALISKPKKKRRKEVKKAPGGRRIRRGERFCTNSLIFSEECNSQYLSIM